MDYCKVIFVSMIAVSMSSCRSDNGLSRKRSLPITGAYQSCEPELKEQKHEDGSRSPIIWDVMLAPIALRRSGGSLNLLALGQERFPMDLCVDVSDEYRDRSHTE